VRASELYDRGAQPERTLLAWGRTCLALAVVVAVVVRVLTIETDAVLVVLTGFGLALPILAWILAVGRYRRAHRELTGAGGSLPAGGTAMAVATVAAVLTAAVALVLVLR
jgi:uncharacterized membrane protein YidH (DUF202 family)